MLIASWNVNGLRAVARKQLLPWTVLPEADVILLQEVKARQDALEPELGEPAGWHAAFHAAEKPGYSGVAALSRARPDEVIEGLGAEEFDREGRLLALRFGTLVVASAYFPNSREGGARLPYKLAFCAELERTLARWVARGYEVVIAGDYNIAHQPIDLARPKENEKNAGYLPQERAWMTRWLGLGMHDIFRERHPDLAGAYTWWVNWANARGRNIGWRIDLATITPGLRDRVTGVQHFPEILGSDHCPITLRLG